ncbi:ATP-dependent RNA helicase [uncultured virus]|nr:ATP-dependent RNA helicase [uncultured virus]
MTDSKPIQDPKTGAKSGPRPSWGLSEADVNSTIKLLSSDASVIGIVAPTGSGKSTTIPEKICEVGVQAMFVVEPTIPAVRNLRAYMEKRMGKGRVGMAAEGDVQYVNAKLSAMRDQVSLPAGTPEQKPTQLVYCTSGHVRRIFFDLIKYAMARGFKDVDLSFCDVLDLDEAHSGMLDYTIIMMLWKVAIERGARVPRLMLSSATLTMADTPFPAAPVYEIQIKGFPVNVEYAKKDYRPDAKELYLATGQTVLAKHAATPIENTLNPETKQLRGSTWIVFCPGLNEIKQVHMVLAKAEDKTLTVMEAHSTNTTEEMSRIFSDTPPNTRSVIIATNIAEASITIDNLSGVFDTMTEKIGETSMSGGFRLALYNISKSSARQRAGRTGRTCPGFCYRMCTEEYYMRLQAQRPDEISRVPLHSMIIETMDAGLDPLAVYQGLLTKDRLNKSIELLEMLGMVSTSPLAVTDSGKFAPRFPLSVRSAAMLWHWIATGKPLFPVISAVTLIDCFGPTYFWYPKKEEKQTLSEHKAVLEVHYETYFKQYDAPTDLGVMLNMWVGLIDHFKTLDIKGRDLVAYNQQHSFNNKKIAEAINIARQTTAALTRLGHKVVLGRFNPDNVLAVLVPIMRAVYQDQVYKRQGVSASVGATYVDPKARTVYRIDMRNALTSEPPRSKELIALLTTEIASRTGALPSRFISLSHPLEADAPPAIDISVPVKAVATPASVPGTPPRAPDIAALPQSRSIPVLSTRESNRGALPPPSLRLLPPRAAPARAALSLLPPRAAVQPVLPAQALALPLPGSESVPLSAAPFQLPDIDAEAMAVGASGRLLT